jgi:hypothetical protein
VQRESSRGKSRSRRRARDRKTYNKYIRLHRRRRLYSMKVMLILASLLALVPMVRADEVVVRHEPTVVVHERHHQNYHRHHYAHHDVIVEHPE